MDTLDWIFYGSLVAICVTMLVLLVISLAVKAFAPAVFGVIVFTLAILFIEYEIE